MGLSRRTERAALGLVGAFTREHTLYGYLLSLLIALITERDVDGMREVERVMTRRLKIEPVGDETWARQVGKEDRNGTYLSKL